MRTPPSRKALIGHLLRHRIAGEIATPRGDSLSKYRRLADRDGAVTFGMTFVKRWTFEDVLALMVELVGVSADLDYVSGPDYVDPERTVDALERMASRIRAAIDAQEPVLLATGHPAGLLPVYQTLAFALSRAGCEILQPASGDRVSDPEANRRGQLRYVGGVATFGVKASLRHTHSPDPMRHILASSPIRPGLVIADHGWAGAAGEAGADTVGFADSNDPGLFVGEAEGKIVATVALDDNVLPNLYAPLTAYVLERAGLPEDARLSSRFG